ncbi:MAG: hypothetical protein IJV43_00485 [Oscillospiraceae bacterium]|nr:hypothetical protein [Oscillospiraceae bacterium]
MPKLRKFEIDHQLNHYTIWETLAYLIPKDDPLRRQAYDMSVRNNALASYGEGLTGKTTLTGSDEEIDSAELWDEYNTLDTDDPGFQQYCADELGLLKKVEEKYKDQPGHGLMMTYLKSLQLDTENLKNGLATETNVAASIFSGSTGLTKMKDVVVDLEHADMNMADMFNSNFKDPSVYEKTAKDFGITELYEEYNAAMETGVDWQKEWQDGEPDPEKLEQLGEKLRGNIRRLDTKIGNFEQKYLEDEKLPDDQRKIYNITNHDDVGKRDLIASEKDFTSTTRAVNGRNWESHKSSFEKRFEKELLAARLMKLQKGFDGKEGRSLRENTKKLITDCLINRTLDKRRDVSDAVKPLSTEEHYALLDAVRQEASGLASKNPSAKGIAEAADKYMTNPTVKAAEQRKADKWIEQFRGKGSLEKVGADGKTVIDTDQLANIMAARMLADSVRGNKKSLGKNLSAKDIADKAAELKNDPTYRGFLAKLNGDPKVMKQAVSAAKSGHGGALDDMFKDHVKHLPAGQLSNNNLMARYMPTARERIEILQAHVAKEEPRELEDTVAEITVLRNLVHAERGKKSSLDKPIPTDPENSLKTQTSALRRDATFTPLVREGRAQTIGLITEGHGGAMVEYFRSAEQKRPAFNRTTRPILNANTVGRRLDQLRQEAADLRLRWEQKTGIVPSTEEAGRLLSEYIVLDNLTRNPKTGEIDKSRMQADVPWSKVEQAVEKGFTRNPQFEQMTKAMGDELVTTVMDDMAGKKQESFIDGIGQKMNKIQEKTQAQAPAERTSQRNVEKAQNKGPEFGA